MSSAFFNSAPGNDDRSIPDTHSIWPKTDWEKVIALRDPASYREALIDLCESYHSAFLRALRRWNAANAEDLTQEFILYLLEENPLANADLCAEKGRFRQYISTMLKNFVRKQYRKEQAQRRGGGVEHVPLSKAMTEAEPLAEEVFDREWARELMTRVVNAFKQEEAKPDIVRRALSELLGEELGASYADLAKHYNKSEATLRSEVARARRRFVERLKQEVALTTCRSELEDELRYLLAALAKEN